MTIKQYIPTSSELEELGFHKGKEEGLYIKNIIRRGEHNGNLIYRGGFEYGEKPDFFFIKLYPQSIDDLKTQIRLLSPNNN